MKYQKLKEDTHNHLDDQGLCLADLQCCLEKASVDLSVESVWQHALSAGQGKTLRLRFMSSKADSVRILETLVVKDLFG